LLHLFRDFSLKTTELGLALGGSLPSGQIVMASSENSLYFREYLQYGDSRAAVVVSLRPLLVAAYTDELDCTIPLEFPEPFVAEYGLRDRFRLLTVNTHRRLDEYDADLIPGPAQKGRWSGFSPIIAEFLSDDRERIEWRKAQISEAGWLRSYMMGKSYLKLRPSVWRDGRPGHCHVPAE
jgi:hypothetical protein